MKTSRFECGAGVGVHLDLKKKHCDIYLGTKGVSFHW